jgi:hypothetical protein
MVRNGERYGRAPESVKRWEILFIRRHGGKLTSHGLILKDHAHKSTSTAPEGAAKQGMTEHSQAVRN